MMCVFGMDEGMLNQLTFSAHCNGVGDAYGVVLPRQKPLLLGGFLYNVAQLEDCARQLS
jgi:hypothetical protein